MGVVVHRCGRAPVLVRMVVSMIEHRTFAADVELCGGDPCAVDTLGPDGVAVDGEGAKCPPEILEGHACVDQRSENHVA